MTYIKPKLNKRKAKKFEDEVLDALISQLCHGANCETVGCKGCLYYPAMDKNYESDEERELMKEALKDIVTKVREYAE